MSEPVPSSPPAQTGRPSLFSISPVEVPEPVPAEGFTQAEVVRALLCAVIGQAVHDLRYGKPCDRATAWRFLFGRPSCFERWCLDLDLSAGRIRAELAQQAADGSTPRRRWDERRKDPS